VGLTAGLNGWGKSRPTGIQSPDRPARSESLYRLSYPGHNNNNNNNNNKEQKQKTCTPIDAAITADRNAVQIEGKRTQSTRVSVQRYNECGT
jgi:hypothetical protein